MKYFNHRQNNLLSGLLFCKYDEGCGEHSKKTDVYMYRKRHVLEQAEYLLALPRLHLKVFTL